MVVGLVMCGGAVVKVVGLVMEYGDGRFWLVDDVAVVAGVLQKTFGQHLPKKLVLRSRRRRQQTWQFS